MAVFFRRWIFSICFFITCTVFLNIGSKHKKWFSEIRSTILLKIVETQKDKPTDTKRKPRKGDMWRFTMCTLIYVINPDTVMKKRRDTKAQPLRWCYTGQFVIQHCCAKNRYVFMAINLLQQRCKNLKSVQKLCNTLL